MTRFLSEILDAREPSFRRGMSMLEAASGHPNVDIKITSEIKNGIQIKLRDLGLDPIDTTPEELYQALQLKLQNDDKLLTYKLRKLAATHVSAEGEVVDGIVHAINQLPDSRRCFALRPSVLKTIIKSQPPKNAMKRLGYRSIDSFLKHESPAALLAAAWLSEGESWQKRLLAQYKSLKSSDFEDRNIALLSPRSARWRQLADEVVKQTGHNLIGFNEMGVVMILPLQPEGPPGSSTALLALVLHELNEIRAASTFLKLCVVRRDFGRIVQSVASEEAVARSQLVNKPPPWQLIQRYFSQLGEQSAQEFQHLFEPHILLDEINWHPIEESVATIEPSFRFWQNSASLGLVNHSSAVSFNLIDVALNYCNHLPFEQRMVHYLRNSIWNEIWLRYWRPDSLERALFGDRQPKLAEELVEV
ncbi:MAG TPA: hypothetical protein VLF79_03645 [Candidatus Saccharimonadales bacterium]|nr:hypothetical protein [Candidatus Saccharimonadales bacterium]